MKRSLVILCFYLSGAAALIYQVVWIRLLVVVVGAALQAVSTVLSAYMAGLALGAYVVGRAIDRNPPHCLSLYGWLELAIGGAAAVVYLLVQALQQQSQGRLPLAFLIVLLPTFLMGATLPVIARYLTEHLDTVGQDVGQLYSANTSGAVMGALLAGFFLIPSFGLFASMGLAVLLNLSAGVLALMLSQGEASPPRVSSAQVTDTEGPKGLKLVLAAYAFSGFTALGFEVIWTRMLSSVLGTSVYAFSTMLVVFLLGIAAGSGWMSGRTDSLARPRVVFAQLLVGTGLSGLLALWLLPHLPRLMFFLGSHLKGFGSYLLLQVVLATIVLLPQTLLFGATLPVVTRIVTPRLQELGGRLGQAYFCNTAGAIVGSLAAGFWLVPELGPARAAALLCGLALLVGLLTAFRFGALAGVALWTLPLTIGLVLTARPWQTDLTLLSPYASPRQLAERSYQEHRDMVAKHKVVFERHGLHSTVVVSENERFRSLSLDGWVVASTSSQDMFIQQALGYFPWLMANSPKRALVVGLGTGVTAASLARAQHEGDELTVAELEAAVVEANSFFRDWSRPIEDKGGRIVIADGRTFLTDTQGKFDLITSDPIHPFSRGSASLYTVEHFRNCRERLTPGGVLVQWLPLYGLAEGDARIVIASFAEVFPEASLWCWFPVQNKTDSLLLGRLDDEPLDFQVLKGRLEELEGLTPWSGAEELMGGFVMRGEQLRRYAEGVPLNTDDHPVLEFTTPRSLYHREEGGPEQVARDVLKASGSQLPNLRNVSPSERAGMAAWMRRGARFEKSDRLEFLPKNPFADSQD